MQADLPPKFAYADDLLEGGVLAFIAQGRERKWSADRIASELYLATDRKVHVTGVTIAAWEKRATEGVA